MPFANIVRSTRKIMFFDKVQCKKDQVFQPAESSLCQRIAGQINPCSVFCDMEIHYPEKVPFLY